MGEDREGIRQNFLNACRNNAACFEIYYHLKINLGRINAMLFT